MRDGVHPLVNLLIDICAGKGVRDFVVAPGSRSAPLTVALARRAELNCRLIFDERSAGYIALGLAQQTGRAVGLVCTSGTAAVNFGPAVVEAFYQGVPLLVLTADRPPEWIDQQDNQAIHQNELYQPHVRGSFTLPLDDGHPDTTWYAARLASNAIELAQGWEPGPVHINVPLREPLYPPPGAPPVVSVAERIICHAATHPQLDADAWNNLALRWHAANRKLIVAGLSPADPTLRHALSELAANDASVAIFADITANLHGTAGVVRYADMIIGSNDRAMLDRLGPDLVVAFGGQVTSKELKTLLRDRPPQSLWHLVPSATAPDTFQALTDVIRVQPSTFFQQLAAAPPPAQILATRGDFGYRAIWKAAEAVAGQVIKDFFATTPFGEFAAVYHIMRALPAGSRLQLGNSMPIRYANLIGVNPANPPSQVNSNRGTSGIDGAVSTAVGAAMASAVLTTLIVGDLGFFYDRNGLWHRHLPRNLRIIVLNNHGGGIFDIIEGPNRLPRPEQERYFLTPQPLSAKRTAADHGLTYAHAETEEQLLRLLPDFYSDQGPALLEVETSMESNTAVYRAFGAATTGLRAVADQ